jgi:predicted RNase H-like nuclease
MRGMYLLLEVFPEQTLVQMREVQHVARYRYRLAGELAGVREVR